MPHRSTACRCPAVFWVLAEWSGCCTAHFHWVFRFRPCNSVQTARSYRNVSPMWRISCGAHIALSVQTVTFPVRTAHWPLPPCLWLPSASPFHAVSARRHPFFVEKYKLHDVTHAVCSDGNFSCSNCTLATSTLSLASECFAVPRCKCMFHL